MKNTSSSQPKSHKSHFIFLCLASASDEHVKDEEAQRRTWAEVIPENVNVFWLRGAQGAETRLENRTLWVNCHDSQILQKTMLGIDWINRNYCFDFLIRSNVSTYFHLPSFTKVLDDIRETDFIAGYIEQCGESDKIFDGTKFISGAAICIPRITAKKLLSIDFNYYEDWPDDVAISHFLTQESTSLMAIKRSNIGSHHLAIPAAHLRCKSSSKSSLASSRMLIIHQFFKEVSLLGKIRFLIELQIFELKNITIRFSNLVAYVRRSSFLFRNFLRYHVLS